MRNSIFYTLKNSKTKKKIALFFAPAIFVFFVAIGSFPSTANAIVCATPDADTLVAAQTAMEAGNFVTTVAQYALEVQQWFVENFEKPLRRAIDFALKQIDVELKVQTTQIAINSRAQETQRAFVATESNARMMINPTSTLTTGGTPGKDTGHNLCYISTSADRQAEVGTAVSELARAIQDLTSGSKTGANDNSSNAGLADLTDECSRGLRRLNGTHQRVLKSINCPTSPSLYPNYVDTDLDPMTVFKDVAYNMPDATTSSKNPVPSLTLPDQSTITDDNQMKFIAAIYTCHRFRPRTPSSTTGAPTASGSDLNSAERVERDLDSQASSLGTSFACSEGIAQRTRISKKLGGSAADGTLLNNMYKAQVRECRTLRGLGYISDAQYTQCQDQGMSYIESQRARACPGLDASLMAAGNGAATPQSVDDQARNSSQNCGRFLRELRASNTTAAQNMQRDAKAQSAAQ